MPDVNVEHLDFYAFADSDSDDVWNACTNFIKHLNWHKPRQTVLRSKIEALPNNHRSKPGALFDVAMLFGSLRIFTEGIRLLDRVLKLEREWGDIDRIALTLRMLSNSNRMLGLCDEGIRQTKEALEIYARLGATVDRARCLDQLARLLHSDGHLDAAEEDALHSIELFPGKDEEYQVCQSHRTLGNIYRSKGQREKAIHHYQVALGIASSFDWHTPLFWTRLSLTKTLPCPRRVRRSWYPHQTSRFARTR